MAVERKYLWLTQEPGPFMLKEALRLYGIREAPGATLVDTIEELVGTKLGAVNNKTIIAWAKEIGGSVADVYKADSIPWCGLFMAVVAKRGSKAVPKNPLWALSWSAFGKPIDKAMLGDVLVFTRDGGGHVGIYVGESDTSYFVLGGNQSDAVSITRIAKSRLYCVRRPNYNNQPKNVRQIMLSDAGAVLSTNEA